jgi:hypothetical protein
VVQCTTIQKSKCERGYCCTVRYLIGTSNSQLHCPLQTPDIALHCPPAVRCQIPTRTQMGSAHAEGAYFGLTHTHSRYRMYLGLWSQTSQDHEALALVLFSASFRILTQLLCLLRPYWNETVRGMSPLQLGPLFACATCKELTMHRLMVLLHQVAEVHRD